MKKLYGLKDEGGKDVVLKVDLHHLDVLSIEPLEKEPEFKVGQWVWASTLLTRILMASGDQYFLEFNGMEGSYSYYSSQLRPATPQEIEAHLKKIAIEKGFKDGVIAKFPNGMGKRELYGSFRYDPNWLTTEDCLSMGDDVIWRPKYGWVEILPSLKKLPKTKEEFKDFLMDWRLSGHNDEKFLNQYED